jgi:outer membrane protein assembly factor BamE (lipoprotein component of BamABCDE complex)
VRILLCVLLVSSIAGCASPSGPAPLGPGEVPSAADARAMLANGRLTKADVRGLLGDPQAAIPFDSGYEVWVYRQQLRDEQEPPRTELVLLFSPKDVLAKTRIKMP